VIKRDSLKQSLKYLIFFIHCSFLLISQILSTENVSQPLSYISEISHGLTPREHRCSGCPSEARSSLWIHLFVELPGVDYVFVSTTDFYVFQHHFCYDLFVSGVFFFNFYFIHMCVQCLRHYSSLPPLPSPPFFLPPFPSLQQPPLPSFLPYPLATWQKLFCPYL
jgi:hypothetical protein